MSELDVLRELRAELEAANKGYDAAHDECVALRAEVAALRKDAERYRWLQPQLSWRDWYDLFGLNAGQSREAIDSAIDAALADKPLSGPTP